MRVTIVRPPIGEAPEWVREAWVGLTLPLASEQQRSWQTVGVLTGPHNWLAQLWTIVTGRSVKVTGYRVNAQTAVDYLADHHPDAAAWWRENTPEMLTGRSSFIFNSDACQHADAGEFGAPVIQA